MALVEVSATFLVLSDSEWVTGNDFGGLVVD
jgi:hypothetical protein